jgi:TonB-linked SusC/RagA family outer membrane protein
MGNKILYKILMAKLTFYRMALIRLILLLFVANIGSVHGNATEFRDEENIITGQVTSEDDPDGFPGAIVLLKGTQTGDVTDINGNYSIEVPSAEAVLVFSSIGYEAQEVRVGNQSVINITLKPDVKQLDEFVVVGYGTQKKSDFTGAVYSVKSEQLQNMPNTNILQGLQGLVPGLAITNNQSAPGSAPQIRIRGESSLSASNDPLIILDGIPFWGNLTDISPNDVETATVLKDASASAIYGARAANGVIIITTKRGKEGKVQINYHGYYGIQNAEKHLDMMNGEQYFQLKVDAARNLGNVTDFSPEQILNSAELPNYREGIETNWQDLVLRTASQQEHNISISGGSENTAYYTSLNFLDQQGIMEYSGMERYTLRTNIDHQIQDWLKTGINIQLTKKDLGGFSDSGNENGGLPDFQDALRLSPYGQLRDESGRYTHFPEFPSTFYDFANPFGNHGSTIDNESKRAILNIFTVIDFPFLEGLSYRLNYSTDYSIQEIGNYWPSFTYYGGPENGIAETVSNYQERWTWENILKYTKDINKHHIDFTGLFSRESFTGKNYRQMGRGFVNDDNLYNYIESADSKEVFSNLSETDLVSYMARINYNYDSKYFFTATTRRDGYSGFGVNNKYGVFPSVALGWIPTEEGFMKNSSSLIDFLKIRASLGENGNMGISPYQTLDAFRTRNYVYGNNPSTVNGLMLQTVGNPFLRWESTVAFNLGIDFEVLDGRISGSVDHYRTNSKNLLMTRQLPIMNGYNSIWYNIGETENKGLEFNLTTINVQKGKLRWTSNIVFSRNRDRIVELRGDGKDDLANNWFIGEPLRVHFDFERDGIWQEGDNIAESHMPTAKPGFTKLKDLNGDGLLDADDRTILGSQLPSWFGSMTNTVSYGNWSFSVNVNTVQSILKRDNILGNVGRTYLDVPYWREDRPSNEFAAPGIIEPIAYGIYNDASFVRIRDASIAYNFSQSSLANLNLSNLRFYISGRNLYTFTDWMGYDPEAANTLGPYPNARTFIIGLNVGF